MAHLPESKYSSAMKKIFGSDFASAGFDFVEVLRGRPVEGGGGWDAGKGRGVSSLVEGRRRVFQ